MLDKILKNLGLSEKESEVYLANLRTGNSKISTIAKRAGITRSTAYNVLNSLYEKGLVKRSNKAGVQFFSPIHPKEIVELLENRKSEINDRIEQVKTYLPQMEALYNPKIELPKVMFYEGKEGIKKIYQDILKSEDKKTFAALSLDSMEEDLKRWAKTTFTKKKIKKGIHSKVLLSSKNSKSYTKLDKKHLRESVVIPHEKYPFEVEIDVYSHDKTAFISYDESEMMGVIIESPKIARTLKSLFSLVWDKNNTRG